MVFCSLRVDYSMIWRSDCVSPHILSLPLINQINCPHILTNQMSNFLILPSALLNDGCPHYPSSLDPVVVLHLYVCIILLEYYYLSVLLFFNHACCLTLPSSLHFPIIPITYLHPHDFYFDPIIPLGHQPGSLLHQQCHPFLCKSWCLHTKLPICTLPALRCLHGSRGPEEHAPAAGGSSALRCPAGSLPAGTHCLPTWLPR